MSHWRIEVRAMLARGGSAAGLCAGIGSFVYGLSRDDRSRYVWLLVGVALVAAVGTYIFRFLAKVANRYSQYPKLVERLANTEASLEPLARELESLREAIPGLWRQGVDEGWSRAKGMVLSHGTELEPGHFLIAEGTVKLSARQRNGRTVGVGGRYTLAHIDWKQPIAIFEVEAVDNTVSLVATGNVDPTVWDRITDRAVAGDPLPPGLHLRPSAMNDYHDLPDESGNLS